MGTTARAKIVLVDTVGDYPEESRHAMAAATDAEFVLAGSTDGDPLTEMRDADALLTTWHPITAEVIAQLQRCKAIVRIGVGYDNIDDRAAATHGIPVCNVPDYGTNEVADHALAIALTLARQLPFLDRCVRDGVWKPLLPYPIRSYATMTYGTLGFGRIGQAALNRAQAFRFRRIAHDPYVSEAEFAAMGVRGVSLEELLTESDLLSLHVPLTDETRHLLNAERFALMKPTTILVNTARGAVVETEALVAALQAGQLAAAGIDVFEEEPLPLDHPLLAFPNVLVTPHYAWHSRESWPRLYVMAVEEVLRAVRNEPLRSCVNGVQPRRLWSL